MTTKELSDYLWKLKCNPIKYSYKSNWDKAIQKLLKEYAKQERTSLTLRSAKIELLEAYSLFLEKNGYMDIDWKTEPPFAIDEFLTKNN